MTISTNERKNWIFLTDLFADSENVVMFTVRVTELQNLVGYFTI